MFRLVSAMFAIAVAVTLGIGFPTTTWGQDAPGGPTFSAAQKQRGARLYKSLTRIKHKRGNRAAVRKFKKMKTGERAIALEAGKLGKIERKRTMKSNGFSPAASVSCYDVAETIIGRSNLGGVTVFSYRQDFLWCGDAATGKIVEDRETGAPLCRTAYVDDGFAYRFVDQVPCQRWGGGIGSSHLDYASQAKFEYACGGLGPVSGCVGTYNVWVWQHGAWNGQYQSAQGNGQIPSDPHR